MAAKACLKNGPQVVPGKELADAFLSYLEGRNLQQSRQGDSSKW